MTALRLDNLDVHALALIHAALFETDKPKLVDYALEEIDGDTTKAAGLMAALAGHAASFACAAFGGSSQAAATFAKAISQEMRARQ